MREDTPTHRTEVADPLQSEFLALLPKIENTVRVNLRYITCRSPDQVQFRLDFPR